MDKEEKGENGGEEEEEERMVKIHLTSLSRPRPNKGRSATGASAGEEGKIPFALALGFTLGLTVGCRFASEDASVIRDNSDRDRGRDEVLRCCAGGLT